ncbi:ACT domain-containing protein [Saccharomonospora xinjiangensis]|uniref:ACT domain-containing protein n=1 Tax=Saccharomonospora xinjiangensis TaxID=75294 RepID=UPI0010C398C8|nr:ACT domain-containing protein [Saccharomonospora xinjiangensis]QBQ61166.1 hypothetical protein EYD13_14070 [Saccharomonospora xinjiangensis]
MRKLVVDVRPGEYVVARWDTERDASMDTERDASMDTERDASVDTERHGRPGGGSPDLAALFDAGAAFVSVTRNGGELSVVGPVDVVPDGAVTEPGWRLLTVEGPLQFTLTGIMAALAGELAAAGVSLFAVSTYDTDHVLVKDADLARAVAALREAGHEVRGT